QEQLQDAINRLIVLWNQNPLSQTKSLIIEGTQADIVDRVIDTPFSRTVGESLDDTLLFENTETLTSVAENPKQIDNPVDSEKDHSRRIRNDLLDRPNNTPFRQNP
ncbi:31315_t:CDS:1, partial [Gigaspora margarita]